MLLFSEMNNRAIESGEPAPMSDLRSRIEAVLDDIRPALATHDGNVALIEIDDGVAKVVMSGACDGCAISQVTLKLGIERLIRERCPEVTSVEAVGGFVPGFDEPLWDYQRSDEPRPAAYSESPVVEMIEARKGTAAERESGR